MGQLKVAERRELKAVIKASYKLLRSEIEDHAVQVKANTITQIEEATEADISRFESETAKIKAKLEKGSDAGEAKIEKLREKVAAQLEEARKEADIEVKELAEECGVALSLRFDDRKDSDEGEAIGTTGSLVGWTHTVRAQELERTRRKIGVALSGSRLAIDRMELEMVRTVALDGLDSEFAMSLLYEIPTPQALVPAPSLKALTG